MTGQREAAELSSWGAAFSCYTAALAVWLARRQDRWWRPLLAGGPLLAVTPAADGLLRFEHHPRPLLAALGLTVRQAGDWASAGGAQRAELAGQGALIICGDVYNLPWQRGYRRQHAPHWFTMVEHGRDSLIIDPLAMSTPDGPQRPSQVTADPARLALWSLAPPGYRPVQRLRELSIAGYDPPGLDAPYRWLESDWPDPAEPAAAPAVGRLSGPAAVDALASRFRTAGPGDPCYAQADDLWQALRQRELLVAAAAADPDLVPVAAAEHWRRAMTSWRLIPLTLMRARLLAQDGRAVDRGRLAAAVAAVAPFEGRHLLADETICARQGAAGDAGTH